MDTAVREVDNHEVLSDDIFKAAFRNHPGGVAVITADPGNGPVGLTATSVISVSVSPPLLAFSLSSLSSASEAISRAGTLVLHLLTPDDLALAKLCSTSGTDRFSDVTAWSRLSTGEPYFHGVSTRILGRIVNRLDAGGSTVVVVEAMQATVNTEEHHSTRPLVYYNRAWHHLGEHSKL